jgi:hypothetical protein
MNLTDPKITHPARSSRREALKQRRLAIEKGEIQVGMGISRILYSLEDIGWLPGLMQMTFKILGLYQQGLDHAKNIVVRETVLEFPNLPSSFEGFRLLHLSDLHLDGNEGLLECLLQRIADLRADICVLTGDYRFRVKGDHCKALDQTLRLVEHLRKHFDGIYGVLGNHDSLAIGEGLEKAGVEMLLNRAQPITRNGEEIWLTGVDDPHYYACHDLGVALGQIPSHDAFKVLLVHSPVLYREASDAGIHLYLCGHTHGGQIRIPGFGALIKNTPTPRRYIDGLWRYNGMVGLTHRGVGSSLIPLRLACPPEIWVIELRRQTGR